ncbi:MAG: hypothetical protein J5969_00680, partial [Lachnospiraceae bacterium]|nr:hypothetical protein [Lachnospiraceae bacterium]
METQSRENFDPSSSIARNSGHANHRISTYLTSVQGPSKTVIQTRSGRRPTRSSLYLLLYQLYIIVKMKNQNSDAGEKKKWKNGVL